MRATGTRRGQSDCADHSANTASRHHGTRDCGLASSHAAAAKPSTHSNATLCLRPAEPTHRRVCYHHGRARTDKPDQHWWNKLRASGRRCLLGARRAGMFARQRGRPLRRRSKRLQTIHCFTRCGWLLQTVRTTRWQDHIRVLLHDARPLEPPTQSTTEPTAASSATEPAASQPAAKPSAHAAASQSAAESASSQSAAAESAAAESAPS